MRLLITVAWLGLVGCVSKDEPKQPVRAAPVLTEAEQLWARCHDLLDHCVNPSLLLKARPILGCVRGLAICAPGDLHNADVQCCPKACVDEALTLSLRGDETAAARTVFASLHPCFTAK